MIIELEISPEHRIHIRAILRPDSKTGFETVTIPLSVRSSADAIRDAIAWAALFGVEGQVITFGIYYTHEPNKHITHHVWIPRKEKI